MAKKIEITFTNVPKKYDECVVIEDIVKKIQQMLDLGPVSAKVEIINVGQSLCFFREQKFYESADEKHIQEIQDVLEIDPEFLPRLAVYCREQMHLRSIP